MTLGQGADLAGHDPALAQQEQSGHSLYAQPRRDAWRSVHIDFHHLKPAREFLGGPLHGRRHHATGATPGRPQVHQHRKAAIGHSVEIRVRGFDQPGKIGMAGRGILVGR